MFQVDPFLCIWGALLLLTLPLNWLLASVIAAAFHEFCHLLTIRLTGGKVFRLRLGIGGAVIETAATSSYHELLCTLAGPMGSLLLLLLYRWLPRVALCAFIQGLFNLLPVYPLDGGRILHCLLSLHFPGKAAQIERISSPLLLFLISILSLRLILVLELGIAAGAMILLVLFRAVLRKRPCKEREIRVQ